MPVHDSGIGLEAEQEDAVLADDDAVSDAPSSPALDAEPEFEDGMASAGSSQAMSVHLSVQSAAHVGRGAGSPSGSAARQSLTSAPGTRTPRSAAEGRGRGPGHAPSHEVLRGQAGRGHLRQGLERGHGPDRRAHPLDADEDDPDPLASEPPGERQRRLVHLASVSGRRKLDMAMSRLDDFNHVKSPNTKAWVVRLETAVLQFGLNDEQARALFMNRVPLSWSADLRLKGIDMESMPLQFLCQQLLEDYPADPKDLIETLTSSGQKPGEGAAAYAKRKWNEIKEIAPELPLEKTLKIMKKGISEEHRPGFDLMASKATDVGSFTAMLRSAMDPKNVGLQAFKKLETRLNDMEGKMQTTSTPTRTRGRSFLAAESPGTGLLSSPDSAESKVAKHLADIMMATPTPPRTATVTSETALVPFPSPGPAAAVPSASPQPQPMQVSPFQRQTMLQVPNVTCFKCNNVGHFARDCAMNLEQTQPAPVFEGRGRGTFRGRRGRGWFRGRGAYRQATSDPNQLALPAPESRQGN